MVGWLTKNTPELKSKMKDVLADKKGYGSIVGTAALVLALLFSIGIFVTSFEKTYDEFTEVRKKNSTEMVNQIQTDVEIDNVVLENKNDNLRIDVINTGSTELEKLKTDLIVNGTLVPAENIRMWVGGSLETDLWLPKENLRMVTDNIISIIESSPSRVKVVSEHGISDYTENIGGV